METKIRIQDVLNGLPADRRTIITDLFTLFERHLPDGFQPDFQHGRPSFVVPKSLYPKGYPANPDQPLPFIAMASQKHHVALYHMGLYAFPDLLVWFVSEMKKRGYRLDMGKSCIRFDPKKPIPYEILAELAKRVSAQEWMDQVEKVNS